MSNRIKILDPITANQIAAGEVVERPASVIKELVENSIDARASKIEIEVGESVLSYLRVFDNGMGISKEDLPLAFQRHATSKITSINDLTQLLTLGFRGEALPSIASVSELEISSRTADSINGWKFRFSGGHLVSEEAVGMPVGTDIIVRNLFFNTPARKKHVKSESTELGHIKDILLRFALAYPEIAFKFTAASSRQWQTDGKGDYFYPLVLNFGEEIASKMLEVKGESADASIKIHGFLAPPAFSRTTRLQQIIFVNRRLVRSRLISSIVEKTLNTLLAINRYPIFCLFIEIKPEIIDVNVHPTKMEIRFSEEDLITKVIESAVKEQFFPQQSAKTIINSMTLADKKISKELPQARPLFVELFSQPAKPDITPQIQEIKESAPDYPLSLPGWRVIGQIFDSFILLEDNQCFSLVDQHAAHERILYEKLLNEKDFRTAVQPLLYPETITLNPLLFQTLIDKIFLFQDFGYLVEHFGQNTILLRAVPLGLDNATATELFHDLLELMVDKQYENIQRLQEKWLILRACKTAIKANQKLSLPEMEALIEQLHQCTLPVTCPHGRPTKIEWQLKELEQLFKRT
ncbi:MULTISPECIES: DNA mismatch repair endonuclease MutL [unclassified Carboxydocella]|uniref:DNA mismatch repair endonuclease MutL n=1 Tax=unclassified Carboxydocella TaxID=2685367 RepID=UPI0009AC3D1F|nr:MULTISPECIES: DNA mismatch repair endonuclease MutL [unclassified Carboxydocella]GAW27958.1 hypothetical protein ULO1_05280 [Carboxydocella sp. ULO1]GAW31564.1 hypothetical protein JDF658_13290 [Carboxydocella sp. JDF658]